MEVNGTIRTFTILRSLELSTRKVMCGSFYAPHINFHSLPFLHRNSHENVKLNRTAV